MENNRRVLDAGAVQCREWMLTKIRSDGYPFNMPVSIETSTFNLDAAQKTLELLLQKHEILRTTLQVTNGCLQQVIHDAEDYKASFVYHDISRWSHTVRSGFVTRVITESSSAAFNFESGPLFRINVFRTAETRYFIFFVFHHMIVDQHSVGVLLEDVRAIYNMVDENGSTTAVFDEQVTQYSRFSAELNELLNTQKGDKYRKFWTACLQKGIPLLNIIDREKLDQYQEMYLRKAEEVKAKVFQLPCYDKRFLGTAIRRYSMEDAGDVRYIFPKAVFMKLSRYVESGRHGLLSLLTAGLLQAFKALSGQTEYVFEMTALNRPSPIYNKTVGWLSTGGLCRFDMACDRQVVELLEYVDENLYNLSKHSLYPYEAVLPANGQELGSRVPVFISLAYSRQHTGITEEGITIERSKGSGTYQDMAFFFTLYNDLMVLDLIYNNFLLTGEVARKILNAHMTCLEDILASENIY